MKTLKIVLIVFVLCVVFGWAGRCDYAEQVVYNMPDEAYQVISRMKGIGYSRYKIAKEYMNNKAHYDALSE